jgi:hypothetical protein
MDAEEAKEVERLRKRNAELEEVATSAAALIVVMNADLARQAGKPAPEMQPNALRKATVRLTYLLGKTGLLSTRIIVGLGFEPATRAKQDFASPIVASDLEGLNRGGG